MSLRSRVCGLALALATSAFGWPALAQQATTCPASINHPADGPFGGLARGLVQTPCADPSLPPATLAPLTAAPAASAPEETPVADLHVASTALGFDEGIAPAPGRAVGYRGRQYLVV